MTMTTFKDNAVKIAIGAGILAAAALEMTLKEKFDSQDFWKPKSAIAPTAEEKAATHRAYNKAHSMDGVGN